MNRQFMPQLRFIHSMRGLCALHVAIGHAYLMFLPRLRSGDQELSFLILLDIFSLYTRAVVAAFIVISGYCLMLSIARSDDKSAFREAGDWRRFLYRRVRRIVPPYYGALGVSLLLIVLIPALSDPEIGGWNKSFPALTPGSVLSHLVLLHNYHPRWQYSIDHPMWSIATEWQLYFLFPILVLVWGRYGPGKLLLGSLLLCVALSLVLVAGNFHNPWPPQFVALFGFGMCAAISTRSAISLSKQDRESAMRRWRRNSLILYCFAVLLTPLFAKAREQVPDFVLGGATAYALIYLASCEREGRRSRGLRLLEFAPLVRLGHFSYSLYLMHAPLLALVFLAGRRTSLGTMGQLALVLAIGLPLVIWVCYLFHIVFERPFVRSNPPQPERDDRKVSNHGA